MYRFRVWPACLAGLLLVAGIVIGQTPKPAIKVEGPATAAPVTPAEVSKAPALTPWETELLNEINALRADPQKGVALLEDYKKNYQGNKLSLPGGLVLATAEGVSAVDDAIAFLKQAKPMPALKLSNVAGLAARDHSRDLAANNADGHKGTDGSWPPERVKRHGLNTIGVGENIYYGTNADTARGALLWMLIDDGLKSRLHRRNLFDETLKFLGLSSGATKSWSRICVLTFVDEAGPEPSAKPRVIKL